MDISILRVIRWIIAKERDPSVIAARKLRGHSRQNLVIAFIYEICARRPFVSRGLNGHLWITGMGAAMQRAIAFIRESCGVNIKPIMLSKRRFVFKSAATFSSGRRLYHFSRRVRNSYGYETAVRATRAVLEVENVRRLFREAKPSCVLIHNDYSELSLALAMVSEKEKVPILLFQSGESNTTPPPHCVSAAVVFPSAKTADFREKLTNGPLIVRPPEVPSRPMRLPSENMPTVGLGLNNFIVKADIVKVVEVLRRRLSPMAIVIRRHPNSQKSLNLEIESDPMEPLVDFLSRCDLLVAGNSGIQLQALCFGVPVIHCGQLDRHPFDAYGLVSRGIVYGVMDADSISMDEVKSFYSSPKWRGVDFPPHDINAAEVLADWLCSCGIH